MSKNLCEYDAPSTLVLLTLGLPLLEKAPSATFFGLFHILPWKQKALVPPGLELFSADMFLSCKFEIKHEI